MANPVQNQQQTTQQTQEQPQQTLGLHQLIKPDQINNIPGLNDDQRKKYIDGVTVFWSHIKNKAPNDPSYQEAVGKLTKLTMSIAQSQKGNKPSQPQSNNQQPPQSQPMQRPPSQGQPGLANGQTNVNNAQQQMAQGQGNRQGQFPPYAQLPEPIRRQAEATTIVAPANVGDPTTFKNEARIRLAQQLYQQKNAQTTLQQLHQGETQCRTNNQPIPDTLVQRRKLAEHNLSQANSFLAGFKRSQDVQKQQQTNAQSHQAARNANGPLLNNNNQSGQPLAQQQQQQGAQAGGMPNAQQRPMTQGSGAQQSNNRPATAASPSATQAATPATLSQQAQQQQQQSQQQGQQQSQQQGQQFQRPQQPSQAASGPYSQQSPQNNMSAPGQSTNPYTQQGAAMDQRSYSNGGASQQAGQQMTTQQFPTPSTEKTNKWPMDKTYVPQAPKPVTMGSMRPTLANPGSAPGGPMGQPAIQQPPSYSLHGPGDHVLSKKKLDDLVKQVCGAGDGANAQGLHPEVEESVLELADEFFDNVVQSACRLAKLRGSQTLEIKDIQLVLQRQYNIRIPGYSMDEIRTVRKVQPTASYLQKMNAIQAAKVMGGKGD